MPLEPAVRVRLLLTSGLPYRRQYHVARLLPVSTSPSSPLRRDPPSVPDRFPQDRRQPVDVLQIRQFESECFHERHDGNSLVAGETVPSLVGSV